MLEFRRQWLWKTGPFFRSCDYNQNIFITSQNDNHCLKVFDSLEIFLQE